MDLKQTNNTGNSNKGINKFKKCYQPRTNLVNDMKSDLPADFQMILNGHKTHFWRLLDVQAVNDLRQIEICKREQLVPEPSVFEDDSEIAIEELMRHKSPNTDCMYK